MKVVAAALTPVGGELLAAVGNGREQWMRRDGLLLHLMDEDGAIGQGEASPLPGYSPDSLALVSTALRGIPWHELPSLGAAASLADAFAPFWSQTTATLDRWLPPLRLPAARFAVETAILDLAGHALGEPLHTLLHDGIPGPIALNAWIREAAGSELDAPAAMRAIDAAVARGLTSIKVKIGRRERFGEELAFLRAVRERFGGAIAIRLDANESWTLPEARRNLAALRSIAPEYVEQPVSRGELPALTDAGVPLAADESLRDPAARAALLAAVTADPSHPCRVFMLKPMVLGGFAASAALARDAARAGIRVVVSHLLDGPVALAAAMELALSLAPPPLTSGLDPHPGLAAWPEMRLPQLHAAAIRATSRPGLGLTLLPGEG